MSWAMSWVAIIVVAAVSGAVSASVLWYLGVADRVALWIERRGRCGWLPHRLPKDPVAGDTTVCGRCSGRFVACWIIGGEYSAVPRWVLAKDFDRSRMSIEVQRPDQ